jgi:hypothetical protein
MPVTAISPASLKASTVARIERIDEILTILNRLRAGEMQSLELLEAILEDA